ncbi:MAG: SDR family NAD(P)-dependent oxidoreductase [Acidimicrobiales bacterium]|jgi:NAD(P)-dependent dehydrogenase (short-subunit alcohol dehydrogenase family)
MTRVTTPFDRNSTAQDVLADVDLSGKRIIVTGASSGIGVETARALAHAGAEVTLAVRDVEAGGIAARDILLSSGNNSVQVARLDLSDVVSIRSFVATWLGPVDVLVNNAGVMALPELELSFEGHERQFATNHLGHFALTVALHQALLAATDGARVVNVSSSAHHLSPVVFSDIDFENRPYDPWAAYGQSKTANVLHAVELTRRWGDDGIVANALNPGAIATNLQRHVGGMQTPENLRKTVEQGAATSALLAGSPLVAGVGGRYFEDCREAEVVSEPEPFGGGVNPFALDPDSARELWDLSLSMLDET